jgi:hypothetical protein
VLEITHLLRQAKLCGGCSNIQWNIFFYRRLGATSGTFTDISDWNAALIPHVTPLYYGRRLSYAPWFKSPYRFVQLNVTTSISHYTITTCILKKYTINICKAAVILQIKTAPTGKKITRIQAPEMTYLHEVEGCAKDDWILTKAIGNVWKVLSSGKEYRITDANRSRASNAYASRLPEITLKYKICIEEYVGRRWQALIEDWKYS